MKIWFVHHYAAGPKYYPHFRTYYYAKNLINMGHEVWVFAASTIHNTDKNLVPGGEGFHSEDYEGIHYVHIGCRSYQKNGIRRFVNMWEFGHKFKKVCVDFGRPDVIVATSNPPFACAAGIQMAKRFKCKAIAEIADLWPESLISYGIAGRWHPLVLFLRRLEKWIYKTADRVVFTMAGAYKYIREQGWERTVPIGKVRFITNSVDLDLVHRNLVQYSFPLPKIMQEPDSCNVVYTGALRKVNSGDVEMLLDMIDLAQKGCYRDYRFIIYGGGELADYVKKRIRGRKNAFYGGMLEKQYVPYLLSACDVNILNLRPGSVIQRYGGSQNKLFDYLASGHPILAGESSDTSLVAVEKCGVSRVLKTAQDAMEALEEIRAKGYSAAHIYEVAKKFDAKRLTNELLATINSIDK